MGAVSAIAGRIKCVAADIGAHLYFKGISVPPDSTKQYGKTSDKDSADTVYPDWRSKGSPVRVYRGST